MLSIRNGALNLVAAALLAVGSLAHAASDYFLKLGDIKGESTSADGQHEGWIELTSVSWPGGREPDAGSLASGRASIQEVTLSKSMDASSAKLSQACASGNHFPTAELHVRKAGGDPDRPVITAYTLFDVALTCSTGSSVGEDGQPAGQATLSTGRSTGDSLPMEQLSLNFGRIEAKVQALPVTAEPARMQPQRVTPKPAVPGPQTGR